MALTGIYPRKLVAANEDVTPCVLRHSLCHKIGHNFAQWLMTWNVPGKSSMIIERRPIAQF